MLLNAGNSRIDLFRPGRFRIGGIAAVPPAVALIVFLLPFLRPQAFHRPNFVVETVAGLLEPLATSGSRRERGDGRGARSSNDGKGGEGAAKTSRQNNSSEGEDVTDDLDWSRGSRCRAPCTDGELLAKTLSQN